MHNAIKFKFYNNDPTAEAELFMNLRVVEAPTADKKKWRFFDGKTIFHAEVVDKEFIDLIERNKIIFSDKDVIRVKLKIKQVMSREHFLYDELKREYVIEKVLLHCRFFGPAVEINIPERKLKFKQNMNYYVDRMEVSLYYLFFVSMTSFFLIKLYETISR